MAQIPFAVAASHAPGLTGWFDTADPASQQVVRDCYGTIAKDIRNANLDVLIMIANDHLANYDVLDYPDFVVGLAPEFHGPDEWFKPWLKIEDYRVAGEPTVAGAIWGGLRSRGFRIDATRDNFRFDDNCSVPISWTRFEETGISLVPILQNCTVPPVPNERYCYEIGQALGDIIRTQLPADLRVGLFGSGGLSHEPGGPNYFLIDEQFDRWFLDLLAAGRHEPVLEQVTYDRMEKAGSGGTSELLSWMIVMGAIGERRCEVLGYTAYSQWRCGIGAVQWDVEQG